MRATKTSKDAESRILPHRSELQTKIYDHISSRPAGCTAGEVERHENFARLGYSTARKRISELHRLGYLKNAGTRNRQTVYVAVPESHLIAQMKLMRAGLLF